MIARLATAALLALLVACRSPAPPPQDGREQLRPVALPDLTRATERVQSQLRRQYGSLTRTLQDPTVSDATKAIAYGEMGKLLMAAEYRDAAELCLLNAQQLATDEARWPYYLGHLYKARGETVKSVAAFERARQRQPGDEATLIWLGNAYLDQGRPEAAEPAFASALARDPRSVAALFGLGRAALARSDNARAAQHLERALSLEPRAAPLHYPLALAYRGLGETDRAAAHMRARSPGEIRPPDPMMLDLESLLESPVAYEVRGARALDARDWKGAAAFFRKGIELAPAEPSLHHKLGTALYMDGDAPAAAAEFEAALRLSPHFAKAHYSLGIMHGASGRTKPAIEHLTAAVRDDPTYMEAQLRLADVLRQSGRSAESLSHYEQAAILDPRVADARFGQAMALVSLSRYQEARDRLRAGLNTYPDSPAFAHALIRLLAAAPDDRVRDAREAMRLLQELQTREPGGFETAEMMAMTLAGLGRFDEATRWQRDAIAAAERAGRGDIARRMIGNLSRYEHHQPCRTPWRDEDGELLVDRR